MIFKINKFRTLLIGLTAGFFYVLVAILSSQSAHAAVACNIWADSTSIYKGQSTMIHWTSPVAPIVVNGTNTNGATQWSTGNLQNTTTYSLIGGYDSSCRDSVTVNVSPYPLPSCSFYSSKNPVSPGESFNVNWNCNYASSATLDGVATYAYCGSVPCSNSKSITKDTTFTLTATGPGGTKSFSLLVKSGVSTKEFSGSGRHNLDCQSGQTNTFLHARNSWLTPSTTSIPQGTNSIQIRLDAQGEVCEGYGKVNVTSDGGVNNKSVDGDSEYIVSSSVSSSPAVSGLSLSGLNGQSAVISRSVQYSSIRPVQAFTSVFSSGYGTLSGLAGLSPGTYNFTVSARVVGTAIIGGRVCVSPVGQPANGVGDTTHCNQTTTSYTFTIVVTGGSPTLSCTTYGPTPATINVGDTATFGWSTTAVTNVVLRNSIDDDEIIIPPYQPSYPVSPEKTTTYYVVATGAGGEERTCPVTVKVVDPQTPNQDAFECKPVFYQILNTNLTKLNPDNGQYEPIGPTGVSNINAIGYNPEDNYMYASITDSKGVGIGRVDNTGKATRIPMKLKGRSADIDSSSVLGDFDSSGNLWMQVGQKRVYKVDVSDGTYEVIKLKNSVDGVNDWVYISGILYGMSADGYLVKVNTNTLTVTYSTNQVAPSGSVYGAAWTNVNNKLYVGRNSPGELYEISDYTGPNPTATKMFDTATTYGNDGASCPSAGDLFTKANYPFLKVNGSDVIAGAKFSSGDICIAPDSTDSPFGTIKTNGFKEHGYNPTKTADILSGSSSAEYAAFAFSKIYSSGGSSSFLTNNGYYRETEPSNFARDLMFANATANQPPMEYGNFNTEGTLPCLNISQIEKSATDVSASVALDAIKSGTTTQVLRVKSGDLDITSNGPGISIAKGRRVTVIVDNAVTINTNIVFDNSSSSDGVINSPQLTIIAKNGIIIKDSVTRLDGYYDAHNSTLKTCDNGAFPSTTVCNKQLIVNGGLVGKKIEWRRNYGTLNSDLTTLAMPDNSRCSVEAKANGIVSNVISAQNECAAEKIDFDPLFYFNNPFSLKPGQSTISGAPLNSVELPPIY